MAPAVVDTAGERERIHALYASNGLSQPLKGTIEEGDDANSDD
jgi:hypothetical protein